MEPITFTVNQTIFDENIDFADCMYIICKGIVQISKKCQSPLRKTKVKFFSEAVSEYPKLLKAGETFG